MLITTLPAPNGVSWPEPLVQVTLPGQTGRAASRARLGGNAVEIEVTGPEMIDAALLQKIVVKLSTYRQTWLGPLLYLTAAPGKGQISGLLRKVTADPHLVDLKLHPGSSAIRHLVLGPRIVEHPLFTTFFAHLSFVDSMPPNFLAEQLATYLGKSAIAGADQ